MRLITFSETPCPARQDWRFGALVPGTDDIVDVARALECFEAGPPGGRPAEFLGWFDLDGPWYTAARDVVRQLATADERDEVWGTGAVILAERVQLLAPVPRPGKIVAVGLNYRDHAAEARMPVPEQPMLFAKFPTAVIGPGAPIALAGTTRVDYEAELAVVIGRRMRGVPPELALAHVLGFTNANDVSERDFQEADGQWLRAKSCDTFAPLGPAIVTLDELPDPGALRVRCRVNGETRQDSSTAQFVFDVPALLAFISRHITLEPGDVVLTGTPPGVGFARQPPAFLAVGDVVEVEIDGLGVLVNPVAATAP